MRITEIKDRYGDTVEVNLDALSTLKKCDNEWIFNFGGIFVPMEPEEGKKLLDDVMKDDHQSRPRFDPVPNQIMVDHNTLDKSYVRRCIMNAHFLDAETKLNLLLMLGV